MEQRPAFHIVSTAWLLAVALVIAIVTPAAAHADPLSADSEAPNSPSSVVLTWPALGLPGVINFADIDNKQDFRVPLPTGMTAARLRGLIQPQVNLGPGYLEVDDDQGTFLGAVDLPPMASGAVPIPFDINISAAHAVGTTVGVSVSVRQFNAGALLCGPSLQLRLTNLATEFTGADPSPATVATFFPPVLQQVTIYAPTDADKAEQQAVLTITAALARLYQPQQLSITAMSQPRGAAPPPAGPLARAVVVERGPAGLQVANPGAPNAFLRVSGRDDQLSAQASLLANGVQSLVQVPAARVDQAGSRSTHSGDTLTFDQLNMQGKADILGRGGLSVGVDLAQLGGRVDDVKVHLLANHTPVSKDDTATAVVSANGQAVYTAALGPSGRVDGTFTLPAAAIVQRMNLDIAITYVPHLPCSPYIAPITFQVDPASTLTVRRGGPAPGGFDALPSEFSPNFVVALDGTSPNQLSFAARVVARIAQATSAALTPQVVDVASAADSKLGALILANAATLKKTSLNPPLAGDGSAITVDLSSQLRADIGQGLGSVQAFADTPRDRTVLLITTTDSWALVNPLLDYIDKLPNGWSQLTGDVLAAGATGTPTDLTIRKDDNALVAQAPVSHLKLWIGIGAALIVVLIGAVGLTLLRRRRAGAKRPGETA
ncbi:hypothetical protein [Mycolicibacterium sphagni]|uniref:Cellulose synthase n=1 Tax=Mycolicibacterium sphagni TaxID=1786 RepID=A0A255DJ50_9MYCO|nr:hypothetical protein [Mycolicibacterium sphagni]OYN78671.1 hypothetical protein CG716_14810 [Mycolicibacterium sphagni]